MIQIQIPELEGILGSVEQKLDEALKEGVLKSNALLLNRIRTRFLQTKDPEGVFWEPSFAAFQRSMLKRKGGGDTLFDTGTLFNSIQLFSVNPYEGAIGTDVPYAAIHNLGLGNFPKREFLGFGIQDNRIAVAVFLKEVQQALK